MGGRGGMLDSRRINFSGAASCVYFALSGGASQLKIVLQSGDLGPGTLTGRILPPSLPPSLPSSPAAVVVLSLLCNSTPRVVLKSPQSANFMSRI